MPCLEFHVESQNSGLIEAEGVMVTGLGLQQAERLFTGTRCTEQRREPWRPAAWRSAPRQQHWARNVTRARRPGLNPSHHGKDGNHVVR